MFTKIVIYYMILVIQLTLPSFLDAGSNLQLVGNCYSERTRFIIWFVSAIPALIESIKNRDMYFLNYWISHNSIKRVGSQSKIVQPLTTFPSISLLACFHLLHWKNTYRVLFSAGTALPVVSPCLNQSKVHTRHSVNVCWIDE